MNTTDTPGAAGSGVRWIEVADAAALRQAAIRRILDSAAGAIERRGRFLIVLAGGDTPRAVYRLLRSADTDWSRWQVYFGDERCLPTDDAARNSRMAGSAWLDHVPIGQDQVHAIPAELGANAAASAYAKALSGVGEFDLVLLGLGADGHTASLFPGKDWGGNADSPDTLAILDAPKPPAQRVSLSAARLGRTSAVLFMIEGATKRSALARWRAGQPLPAAAIRPAGGVDVLFDSALLAACKV